MKEKVKRKRWRRTIDSFKVGQFYRIPWEGNAGELIVMVTDVNPQRSIYHNRGIETIIISSSLNDALYINRYIVGDKYYIEDWEFQSIKLMRFKKEKTKKI
jgi:hypothetical protein